MRPFRSWHSIPAGYLNPYCQIVDLFLLLLSCCRAMEILWPHSLLMLCSWLLLPLPATRCLLWVLMYWHFRGMQVQYRILLSANNCKEFDLNSMDKILPAVSGMEWSIQLLIHVEKLTEEGKARADRIPVEYKESDHQLLIDVIKKFLRS